VEDGGGRGVTNLDALVTAQGLTSQQRELLQHLLKAKRLEVSGASGIERRQSAEPPLSYAQQRLWFLHQLSPGSFAYNLPAAVSLRGRLDARALARSLTEVTRRHEVIRATFMEDGGVPIQRIAPAAPFLLPIVDLAGLPLPVGRREARRAAREEARRPFDLTRGPLLRVTLVRMSAEESTALVNLHHIAGDGWSIGVLVRELGELYGAFAVGRPPSLPELPIQYGDFAHWQRRWLTGGELERQLAYWRQRLAGAPAVLDLPTDRPRPPVQSLRGKSLRVELSAPLVRGMKTLGQGANATLFMVLLASFEALLARYTGAEDLVVGSPIANRSRVETEGLIGLFANPLPLRGDLSGDPSFRALLERVREATLQAYAHQDLPFERLVEELRPERSTAFSPLFQVLLALQNAPAARLQLTGLTLELSEVDKGTEKFDLSLNLEEVGETVRGTLSSSVDLFDRTTVERLWEHLVRLVAAGVEAPGRRSSELALFSPGELHQLIAEWNDAELPTAGGALHGLFAAQVRRSPESLAVVCGAEAMTYEELDRRAERLAGALRRLGVAAEVPVGICLERSIAMVSTLLGVLKAGGCYLPIDPSHPQERQAFLLRDAASPLVLTQAALAPRLAGLAPLVVCLEEIARLPEEGERAAISAVPAISAASAPGGELLAYLIYTSGSTGSPKGVAITHRSAVALVRWAWEAFPAQQFDGVLASTSLGFDLSVFELFVPLSLGGTVVLAPNALELPSLPAAGRVTLVNTVPSTIAALLDGAELPVSVAVVNLAGEALTRDLVDRLYAQPDVRQVYNLYGPSEDTTYSTWALAAPAEPGSPPIGRPVTGTQARVLDRRGEVLPQGVPGELCLGGAGLARGYLARPDLTAERFVPDRFAGRPGARLYRTGDLARQRTDGSLEFLGRLDHQVKVRGFRIEPGEIEAVLAEQPGVREAVVLPRSSGLSAYVTTEQSVALDAGRLREGLRRKLPEYMVPHAFVVLDRLPLTPNGKVDRQALAALEPARESPVGARPKTPLEELVADLFADLLGGEGIGSGDDFFSLGGHSLLATRMISRVRSVFGVELPVRTVFESPTVAGLALSIERARGRGERESLPPLVAIPRQGALPLSYAQERLWFLHQLEPESAAYNIFHAIGVGERLDPGLLAQALSEVARRHESLRTRFVELAGQPVQVIDPPERLALPEVDLGGLPAPRRESLIHEVAAAEEERPFDLSRGPLVRVKLLRLEAAEQVLLFSQHHIVSDGWSAGVLLRELGELYAASLEGRRPVLAELTVQYVDYAVWQRKWLVAERLEREIGYWRDQLAGAPALLDLPLDRPRPAVRGSRGGRERLELPRALAERIRQASRAQGATPFMLLQAAFQAVLARLSGATDVVLGSPVAGRSRLEIEGLIGCFINTVVLRLDLSGEPTFGELLGRAREAALGAFAHQELPFEHLVEALAPQRSLSYSPIFQVMLVLQNLAAPAPVVRGLGLRGLGLEGRTSKFDLTLTLSEGEGGLAGFLTYSRELFDPVTAQRLVGYIARLLDRSSADSASRVWSLALLARSEEQQLLEWSGSGESVWGGWGEMGAPIHELVGAQAARTPGALAVRCGEATLRYGELVERADLLARRLRQLGVGPEVVVGLWLEPSLAAIVGLLGILWAGGVYVPLDPEAPAERQAAILADAGIDIVLTRGELAARLPVPVGCVVDLAGEGEASGSGGAAVSSGNLAYVLYTSGSTGRPKGVAVAHRALVSYSRSIVERLEMGCGASFAMVQPLTVDSCLTTIFPPLLTGGSVHVVPREVALDAPRLTALFRRYPADGLKIAPSHLSALLAASAEPESLLPRRWLVVGGEASQCGWLREIDASAPGLSVFNHYGPTETTVGVLMHRVTSSSGAVFAESTPLGRALGNSRTWVLDGALERVAMGSVGRLYIGGECLARGYLGHAELTAERFVPDPYSGEPGARLYDSGDLVRSTRDGELVFLGRSDHQVKIRGFRIELGEIESALARHPGVREVVVRLRDLSPGRSGLVAYLVGRPGIPVPGAQEVRRFLSERLPEPMIPGVVVELESLPLTPHGKLDGKALPLPSLGAEGAERSSMPRTPAEELLAGIWAEVLGVEHAELGDDFFALGGHSLLATQVISRVRSVCGVELPVRAVFESPSLAELASRIEQALGSGDRERLPPLVALPREGALPLSYAQERLWFLHRLEPGSTAYNIFYGIRLSGDLEPGLLAQVLSAVVRRHESLRTRFVELAGQPRQVIDAPKPFVQAEVDLRGLPAARRAALVQEVAAVEEARPFDLSRGPLLRMKLLRLGAAEWALLFSLHHIVSDGWSAGVLRREVSELYTAFREGRRPVLAELPVQYADYAVWHRGWLSGEALSSALPYWRRRLAGAPALSQLPTDRPRPSVQRFSGRDLRCRLPVELTARLRGHCRGEGVTLFMGLLASFAVLLCRHGSTEEVVMGTAVAGRNRRELEGVVGPFLNSLALRVGIAGEPSWRAHLAAVREECLGAFAHQDLPFEKLVQELAVARDLAHTPVFQVMLVLQNARNEPLALPGLSLTGLDAPGTTSKLDLTLSVQERGEELELLWHYNRDLFDETTVSRLSEHLSVLLGGAVAQPEQRIAELSLLSAAEEHQLREWNDTASRYETGLCLHERILAQARRSPDRTAVLSEEEGALSYGELASRSLGRAGALRSLGVGPEVRVGVLAERSLGLVEGLLAVLCAGGAYLPLDPDYPPERLSFLLSDSGSPLVLVGGSVAGRLPAGCAARVLSLAGEAGVCEVPSGRAGQVAPENLAYVIYTSGSTGRPKGTLNTHRGIVNRLDWMQGRYGLAGSDRVLQKTPLSFDVSVWELFWPLLNGACLVLARPGGHQDSAYLVELIVRQEVTTLHFVPSMLQVFSGAPGVEGCVSLSLLVASGEALPAGPAARAQSRLPRLRLENLYGPTEAAVDVTYWRCAPGVSRVPIGRPVSNTSIRLLSGDHQPVGIGVAGELLIAGVQVSRGYLGRAELTAERFVPDPLGCPGERLYRTGDLARYLASGEIEYLGRLDHQVKVRGFRIELGEVEAALLRHRLVGQAVVVARAERSGLGEVGMVGAVNLVAYVSLEQTTKGESSGLSLEEVRRFLGSGLPEHMLPSSLVVVDALPLLPNGKVDRRSLPEPERTVLPARERMLPRTGLERWLSALWVEVLRGEAEPSVHDSFFAVGGNSITGAILINRLQEELGEIVHVVTIFDRPTIAELAAYLESEYPLAVARRLGREAGGETAGRPWTPIARRGSSAGTAQPLSFAQERLWFLDQLDPGKSTYNIPAALRLSGDLKIPMLIGSLEEVVRRHAVLRTSFRSIGGRPMQVVRPPGEARVPFSLVDLSGLPAERREGEARRRLEESIHRPFDLARGPLVRSLLLCLEATEHLAVLTLHHIVADGWSMGVLVREIGALYPALVAGVPSPLPELPVQYADYAVWQREWLSGEVLSAEVAYWRERLAGAPALSQLPTDRPRPAVQRFSGRHLPRRLPGALTRGLRAQCREEGVTLFVFLLAAFEALLHRQSGEEVVVGTPVAGRNRPEVEEAVGLFLNNLVLRGDLSGSPSWRRHLRQTREVVVGAFAHQDLPFEKLVEELAVARDLAHAPLFQVMLVLQNPRNERLALPGLSLSGLELPGTTSKLDLTLSVQERGEELELLWHYNRDLFDETTVCRLSEHLSALLGGAVAGPERRVAELSLLCAAEEHQLREWNDTASRYETGLCLHERILAQARRSPDRTAVLLEEEGALSYGELASRALDRAGALRGLGVGPEVRVGVLAERSLGLVEGLLAVLCAGGAYLPLDPDYPPERLSFLLSDSGSPLVLVGGSVAGRRPAGCAARVLSLAGEVGVCEVSAGRAGQVAPENLAYVIYTSGSTGRPKGTLNTHCGIVNRLDWMQERYGLVGSDRVLQKTPLSFDVSVWELFWPLLNGACLVLARPGGHQDSAYLVELITRQEVTTLHFVPSMLQVFAGAPGVEGCVSLSLLVASGEALPAGVADRAQSRLPRLRLENLYGPTEAAVDVTYWGCAPGANRVPIGRPVSNTSIRLVSGNLQPVGIGVSGELLIAGVQLSRGYLGRAELTAERFVPDPLGCPGERLYRTGDLARYLPSGEIEYLGRLDHQVKVRGFRIELGEVEAALLRHPLVGQAVVVARAERSGLGEAGTVGAVNLVAYVSLEGATKSESSGLSLEKVRRFLGSSLLEHMLPSSLVVVDALPLLPNGKVDRRSLPEPERTVLPALERVLPRTGLERWLSALWVEVLRGEAEPSVHDSFFAVGGNSITGAILINRLQEELGEIVHVVTIFDRPTLAELAAYLESEYPLAVARRLGREAGEKAADRPWTPIARRGASTGTAQPLSFAQERLWFLDQLDPGKSTYNIPAALRLSGDLKIPVLLGSLEEVVRRHAVLRTSFRSIGGRPMQVVGRPGRESVPFSLVNLSGLPAERREGEARRRLEESVHQPFDLARGPLVRSLVLRLEATEYLAVLTVHHIVSDGWSMGVLVRELGALYRALVAGAPSPLPELPVQYADYAVWQREWLSGEVLNAEVAYWRERLAGAPALSQLPTDRPRPAVQRFSGRHLLRRLPGALARGLRERCREEGVTLFVSLLAAFEALLHRHSGEEVVVVGTPVAGRNRPEVEGTIGLFLNNLVLRGDLSGSPSWRRHVRQTREVVVGAFAHQDLPFERLVEELTVARDLAHAPLFQVMLVLQNARNERLSLPGLSLSGLELPGTTSKLDLTLSIQERGEELGLLWHYNRDLFDETTMSRLSEHLSVLLRGAVARPERRVAELSLLSAAEEHQLREWNDTESRCETGLCLHERILRQARRSPDRTAVLSEEEGALSYGELASRALRRAEALQGLGVGPEVRVGVLAERSPGLVEGLLAVLCAGGAYLPLDPDYPPERLSFLLSDSGSPFVLVGGSVAGRLPAGCAARVLSLAGEAGVCEVPAERAGRVSPENLAYVIYTSGSTGWPKGTLNTHRGIVNRLAWMQERYGLVGSDRVLQKTPLSFDVSVWELFWPLSNGACLVLARPGGHQDSAYLVELIARQEVTTLHFVPSMLQVFAGAPGVEGCVSLSLLVASGEALPAGVADRAQSRLPRLRLENLYGPTEAAVDVTYWGCAPGANRVPIGRPVSNTSIRLVSGNLQPVGIGVSGELLIAGVQLSRGYLGRAELTAERFVPDPLGCPGERLYRTGDLARYLPSGEIEYLGRLDHQVKVRGFRIELGEVEAALLRHPLVGQAVVVARAERSGLGERREVGTVGAVNLVAYVSLDTASGGESSGLSLEEVRRFLGSGLPEHMLPSSLVVVDALPLLPNGKVDRRSLPEPERTVLPALERVLPRTGLERWLSSLWVEVLRGEAEPSVHDSLFAVGGNSITGAILINRLQEELGEIVHVVTIFDRPTIAELAAYLESEYPLAVARRLGREAGGGGSAAMLRVDEEALDQVRNLLRRLPPRPAEGAARGTNRPALFVLSPPRSGSTLLRVMLGGHPGLFAPPELELLNFETLADRQRTFSGRDSFRLEGATRALMEARGCGVEEAKELLESWEREALPTAELYRRFQEWIGGRMLVDKTPTYAWDPRALERAEELFSGALYLHLVRHPLGVVRSFEEARLEQIFLPQAQGFSRRELAELLWVLAHENILEFLSGVALERQHRVYFEDLVREPERVLAGICSFLGIAYDPAMAEPYRPVERSRMTDGLYAASRMLGDVKFHQHGSVKPEVAERWREEYEESSLGSPARRLSLRLGYASAGRLWTPIARRGSSAGTAQPLSFAQERLWFLDQLDPGKSTYNIPSALRLSGDLKIPVLIGSLEEVVRRHAVLRTSFRSIGRRPMQVVGPAGRESEPFSLVDLAGLPAERREGEARRRVEESIHRPFDLARGPLMRSLLLRLEAAEHLAVLTVHHIVADGWSMGVLVRELGALYRSLVAGVPSPLPELPVQYADYAVWQREQLSGEALSAEVAYWRERLAGAPALELPTDRPRPAVQRSRGSRRPLELGAEVRRGLASLARQHQTTLFMVGLAGFAALLARHSGQQDFAVGTPVSGRTRAEIENLIGFFVNILVLRFNLAEDPTFAALLAQAREVSRGAFAHQEVPFEQVVAELQPERTLSRSPLFQALFVFQNARLGRLELPDLLVSPLEHATATAKFDLSLTLGEAGEVLRGGMEYATDLFDPTTIQRMCLHLEVMLAGAITEPERPLSQLPLFNAAERQQLVEEWNDTAVDDPSGPEGWIHELFERQVARRPEALAVSGQGRSLSYGELEAQANRLAHYLRHLGVEPEARVALCVERSPEMVVALLGILKAGGAYVPLDPGHPAERLALVLGDSAPKVLLTEERWLERLEPAGPRVVCLDRDRARIAAAGKGRLGGAPSGLGPESLAYVIYTSGSTGRPKGVCLPHGAVVNFLRAMANRLGLGAEVVIPALTTLTFDIAGLEIYLPLALGGQVEVVEREEAADGRALARRLAASGSTIVQGTPATWRLLLEAGWAGQPGLKALCGGEALPRELASAIAARGSELWNLYGPTEAAVWSAAGLVVAAGEGAVGLGRPLARTRFHVVDRELDLLPAGASGELLIGGAGVARGYWRRPELTAERFVPDPWGPSRGARLYRTGDLVRQRADGELEFLGRIDQQVKLRGFRIELGEIEAALASHPAVREAAVLLRGELPGGSGLVAYVVATGAEEGQIRTLRGWLGERLPGYMVPTAFVELESLPRTPNGKVDRRALPAPQRRSESAYVAPRNPVEEILVQILADLLAVPRVGVADRFFELGGNSLLATQVMARVFEAFGVHLQLRHFFESPTVEGVAAAILADPLQSEAIERTAALMVELARLSDAEVDAMLITESAAPAEGSLP
jgi:amino acid adenylation domain-containing protein